MSDEKSDSQLNKEEFQLSFNPKTNPFWAGSSNNTSISTIDMSINSSMNGHPVTGQQNLATNNNQFIPMRNFQTHNNMNMNMNNPIPNNKQFAPPNQSSFTNHMNLNNNNNLNQNNNANNSFYRAMFSTNHMNGNNMNTSNNNSNRNNNFLVNANGNQQATIQSQNKRLLQQKLINLNKNQMPRSNNNSIISMSAAPQQQSRSAFSDCEQIFHDCVPIIMKSSSLETRTRELTLKIEKITQRPQNQQVLAITLTDETDPFFLFSLQVSESDFRQLRSQQSLLVDFAAFPKSLVCLLQQCLQCSNDEHPKFVAVIQSAQQNNTNCAFLSVQETNQFRHLQHISLQLRAASDQMLREYLGKTLMHYKQSNLNLGQQLNDTKNALSHAQNDKKQAEDYVTQIKQKTEQAICDLKTAHAQQLSELKQNSLETQDEIRKQGVHGSAKIQQEAELRCKAMELKFNQLKQDFENLQSEHFKTTNDQTLLTKQHQQVTTEHTSQTEEIKNLRNECKSLDQLKYKNEKSINHQMITIAALEQQIKDKQEISDNNTSLLEAEKLQRKSVEEALQMYKSNYGKSEKKVHECVKEINKGNEIIAMLQNKIRDSNNKNKLKEQKLNVLHEKNSNQNVNVDRLQNQLKMKDDAEIKARTEIKQLKQTLRECKQKLEQSQKAIESNQRIIQYLNKQLNQNQMGGNMFSNPSNLTRSGLSGVSGVTAASGGSNLHLKSNQIQHSNAMSMAMPSSLSSSVNRGLVSNIGMSGVGMSSQFMPYSSGNTPKVHSNISANRMKPGAMSHLTPSPYLNNLNSTGSTNANAKNHENVSSYFPRG